MSFRDFLIIASDPRSFGGKILYAFKFSSRTEIVTNFDGHTFVFIYVLRYEADSFTAHIPILLIFSFNVSKNKSVTTIN